VRSYETSPTTARLPFHVSAATETTAANTAKAAKKGEKIDIASYIDQRKI